MSQLLDSVVSWIGDIAPLSFLLAVVAGGLGSLVSAWTYAKMHSRKGTLEIERLLKEIEQQDLSEEERIRLYRSIVASFSEELRKAPTHSRALAHLGEYLSNRSPSDRLTRAE